MKNLASCVALLVTAFSLCTNATAAIIDDFGFGSSSTGDSLVASSSAPGYNIDQQTNTTPDVSILGGLHTAMAYGGGGGTISSRINYLNSGYFSLDIDDNFTFGTAAVIYDGNGSMRSGLGGVNLTNLLNNGSTDDRFDIGLVGLVGVIDIAIEIVDTLSNTATAGTGPLTNTGTVNLAFSAFSGVDLTSVDSITLILNSLQDGADADIEFFGTSDSTPPASSVPVPGSIALLGLGLFGLRRKPRA